MYISSKYVHMCESIYLHIHVQKHTYTYRERDSKRGKTLKTGKSKKDYNVWYKFEIIFNLLFTSSDRGLKKMNYHQNAERK